MEKEEEKKIVASISLKATSDGDGYIEVDQNVFTKTDDTGILYKMVSILVSRLGGITTRVLTYEGSSPIKLGKETGRGDN